MTYPLLKRYKYKVSVNVKTSVVVLTMLLKNAGTLPIIHFYRVLTSILIKILIKMLINLNKIGYCRELNEKYKILKPL